MWLPVLSPVIYMVRRLCFCASVVYFPESLCFQLMVQFYFSTCMVIYLVYFNPLISQVDCFMETFNEVTAIFLMYHLMSFSDFVPSAETRNMMGFSFVAFAGFNIAIHLIRIGRENYDKLKSKFCQKYIKR